MNRPMKVIPIRAAEKIAKDYGYDQVIIYARRVGEDPLPNGEHMTTYGINKLHCDVAARIGATLKRLCGWHTEREQWVEREAMRAYTASIPADTHNLHCRAWSELTDAEKLPWQMDAGAEWDAD